MGQTISVVIPAYNAKSTIERCVKSVLNQSYENLEVIVVNDGSSDSTETICEKMASYDSRLKVITIKNGGVSHARNIGIDNAKGDYITFVDSDDYIDKEMYKNLMDLFDTNVDIVHCSYKNVDESGNILSVVGSKSKQIKMNHDEGMECLLAGKYFAGGLWNKIYRAKLFSNVRLKEDIKFNEDVLANYYLFDNANNTVYSDEPFYNYVACDDSSTHSANALISYKQGYEVARIMLQKSMNKPYCEFAKIRYLGNLLGLYGTYRTSLNKVEKSECENLFSEIKSFKDEGYYQGKRDKVLIFMYRYMPHFYLITYKIYDKIRVKKLDPEQ